MFDAPTKKPLPEMPDIEDGKGLMSREVPKPISTGIGRRRSKDTRGL